MRQRPPAGSWRSKGHSQSVTGLVVTTDTSMTSGSLDGKVRVCARLWGTVGQTDGRYCRLPDQ